MTSINKIDLQVLEKLPRRANLINRPVWIFDSITSIVCSIRKLFAEVTENLVNQYQFLHLKTEYETNCDAPK